MPVRLTVLLLMVLLPQAAAANNKQVSHPQTDEPPDAELLEFIAEFEPLEGQWIDPIQLNMIFAENRDGKEND